VVFIDGRDRERNVLSGNFIGGTEILYVCRERMEVGVIRGGDYIPAFRSVPFISYS
jgi:hypothetical protein